MRTISGSKSTHSFGSCNHEIIAEIEEESVRDAALVRGVLLAADPPPIEARSIRRNLAGIVDSQESSRHFQYQQTELRTEWRSIYVATMLSFCSAVQFSLYFSSMWPFLLSIDKSATETFFGYIVSAYSLGQILGSPAVGYLSNRMKQIRHLLYLGLALMFIGNSIYYSIKLFHAPNRKYWLIVSRFVTGIGSSNISLLKAYVSTASTLSDRSRAIAFVTGGVALGMTMGPAFQLCFFPIGFPGLQIIGKMYFSMYTAPAYMASISCIFCVLCIHFLFRERYVGIFSESKESDTCVILPKYDLLAVALCHITRFTQMLTNTNIETIGASLSMLMFSWSSTQAVEYLSAAQAFMSLLAFAIYILFIAFRFDRIMNFRLNCLISLVILAIFHFLTFSYPFLQGNVQMFTNADIPKNRSARAEPIGCNTDKFSWCDNLHPVNPYLFYLSYIFLIGTAFPLLNIALNTLFSKIIGPRRQGTQQGILQMSGGMARMIGPVIISQLYTIFGPQSTWLLEIGVIALTIFLWLIFYSRMVPLEFTHISCFTIGSSGTVQQYESIENDETAPGGHRKHVTREERKPLVEPIDEESEIEERESESLELEQRNTQTVSTICSNN